MKTFNNLCKIKADTAAIEILFEIFISHLLQPLSTVSDFPISYTWRPEVLSEVLFSNSPKNSGLVYVVFVLLILLYTIGTYTS